MRRDEKQLIEMQKKKKEKKSFILAYRYLENAQKELFSVLVCPASFSKRINAP